MQCNQSGCSFLKNFNQSDCNFQPIRLWDFENFDWSDCSFSDIIALLYSRPKTTYTYNTHASAKRSAGYMALYVIFPFLYCDNILVHMHTTTITPSMWSPTPPLTRPPSSPTSTVACWPPQQHVQGAWDVSCLEPQVCFSLFFYFITITTNSFITGTFTIHHPPSTSTIHHHHTTKTTTHQHTENMSTMTMMCLTTMRTAAAVVLEMQHVLSPWYIFFPFFYCLLTTTPFISVDFIYTTA